MDEELSLEERKKIMNRIYILGVIAIIIILLLGYSFIRQRMG